LKKCENIPRGNLEQVLAKTWKMQKTSYSGANVCIYANATILEEYCHRKTVLLVEIHGLPNHSGRFACYQHHNNRSKNKRTKIAWSLKIIRPYWKYPLVESVNLIKNKKNYCWNSKETIQAEAKRSCCLQHDCICFRKRRHQKGDKLIEATSGNTE
jgi:hypothetical protein